MEENTEETRKPYKIKDVTRTIKKSIVAASLEEIRSRAIEKFNKTELPTIHLDCDGTEIDDEDYFQTLEPNTELIAVFAGERWNDPTQYITVTTHRNSDADATDGSIGEVERIHLKKLVKQIQNNMGTISILSEPELEMLSNMDPNSVADITGREFTGQVKEVSERILYEKRQAYEAIELLNLIARGTTQTATASAARSETPENSLTSEINS